MKDRVRPQPPKRAVITAGMPYGNKSLHFGHIGGVFVHADTFYRFLKDRIGAENVIFVSGTDCYGSPIIASYKNYVDECMEKGGEPPVSLEDYVLSFCEDQKKVLDAYEVSPSFYAASAFGEGGKEHKALSAQWFNRLREISEEYCPSSCLDASSERRPILQKLSTLQFYDSKVGAYLNGRQVNGKCPVDHCTSTKAYADECSMGHQYQPEELIDPISTLSGTKPELVEVENWYFDLPRYMPKLKDMIEKLKKAKKIRPNVYAAIDEFLKPPVTYVKREDHEELMKLSSGDGIVDGVKCYIGLVDEPKKPSVTYEYNNLAERDAARKVLDEKGIRYRTGKTLVPFRLSGNVEWGVPVPNAEGLNDLTFWVWPESLWAPISFTKAHLKHAPEKEQDYKKWWFDKEASQYQFIGEDNVYFYGIAEMGMLMAHLGVMPDDEKLLEADEYPQLVSNSHLLFMGKKASSSDEIKPPMAIELLDYYSVNDLRMHFLSLGLSKKSVSFSPMAFAKTEEQTGGEDTQNTQDADPVLKDGNVLTNVYNRILRSCFYTAQEYTEGRIPLLEPSEEIKQIVEKAVLEYERNMLRQEFHLVIYAVDDVIRKVSKFWAKQSKNEEGYPQLIADCFYAAKIIAILLHPITPAAAENIRMKMNLSESLWDWAKIFEPITAYLSDREDTQGGHLFEAIPPRYDFYEKKIYSEEE